MRRTTARVPNNIVDCRRRLGVAEITSIVYVYLLSLLPSFEGRYAIIVGISRGLDPIESLGISSLGVITLSLALPRLLPLIDKIALRLSNSRLKLFSRTGSLYYSYVSHARRKVAPYMDRYGFWGLIVFVAIPLPGTGIWTGSIAAYILGASRLKTTVALLAGGMLSNIITLLPSMAILAAT